MTTRIVVCDDESHITRAIQMKLSKAGFRVETAPDGQAAWEAVQRETPAMLISDYQMPRLDGLALCRRIREHAHTRHVPIVLLTAKGFELDAARLKEELGLTDVVGKPFSPRELLSLVEQTLLPQASVPAGA